MDQSAVAQFDEASQLARIFTFSRFPLSYSLGPVHIESSGSQISARQIPQEGAIEFPVASGGDAEASDCAEEAFNLLASPVAS